jgi:hypothetical protein
MPTVASPNETALPESRRDRTWRVWRVVQGWCERQGVALSPSPEARRGAMWGLLFLLVLFVAVRVIFLSSGHGVAFDMAFVTATTAMVIVLLAMLVAGILVALRTLPLAGTGVFVGTSVLISAGSFSQPSISLVAAVISVCVAACVLGATIATLASGRRAGATIATKALAALLLAAAGAYAVGFVWVLADDGDMEKVSSWRPRRELMPPNSSAPNPGLHGPYTVRTLTYGSGTDIRRTEYNAAIAIRTRTVDASRFFTGYDGWRRWARTRFWGFDLHELPLNARVWYPEGPGPFPLVLIAHRNHRMNEFSEAGYAYLGELLASRGFILASIDQNLLNGIPGFRESTAMELPRSAEAAGRLAPARAPEPVARMESTNNKPVLRQSGPESNRTDGPLPRRRGGRNGCRLQPHEVLPRERNRPLRLCLRRAGDRRDRTCRWAVSARATTAQGGGCQLSDRAGCARRRFLIVCR